MPTPERVALAALAPGQRRLLATWFDPFEVVADLSWGLVDTVVLHLRTTRGEVVVKAAGPDNHHIRREIEAHRVWTAPWLASGSVGRLVEAAENEVMFTVEYLPGELVQNDPEAAADPDTYRQAGALLAAFHGQASRLDDGFEAAADAKALAWLDREHRIEPATVASLRDAIASHDHQPVQLVPTHGDWQTRNWLVDRSGTVRVIDLGRAEWRPALTDLARLARREWQGQPALEAAFIDGYGTDPRDPVGWRATLLREAVGTAVWAYLVGDVPFEEQGHRMIEQALAAY
jgi:aminoglycoside phosphotransferase